MMTLSTIHEAPLNLPLIREVLELIRSCGVWLLRVSGIDKGG